MQIKDLKLFNKPIYYNPKVNIDLSNILVSSTDIKLMKPDIYPVIYKDVIESLYSDEHDKINVITYSIMKRLGKVILNAPAELICYIHLLNDNTTDFQLYPTFYSQGIIDIIEYYTKEQKDFIKSEYTWKTLIEKIVDNNIELVDEIELRGPDAKFIEVYIKGVGIGIFEKSFVSKFPSRKAMSELRFINGELMVGNSKVLQEDKRRNSILDWRRS